MTTDVLDLVIARLKTITELGNVIVTGPVTVTIATPGVFSMATHGMVAGQQFSLTTTGALPTGLAAATPYYVLASGLTAGTFKASATVSGAAINTSGTQSGVHTLTTPEITEARVAGIVQLEQASEGLVVPVPYAYVLMLAESAPKSQTITIMEQHVTVAFGVVLCIANTVTPLGATGGGSQSTLQALRQAIIAKLLGWQPDSGHGPCEFKGGRLVQVRNGVLWWQDEFFTDYYLRSDAP